MGRIPQRSAKSVELGWNDCCDCPSFRALHPRNSDSSPVTPNSKHRYSEDRSLRQHLSEKSRRRLKRRTGNCECTHVLTRSARKNLKKIAAREEFCGRYSYGNNPRTRVASATRPTARIMAPARGGTR